jgi:pyridoxine 4-dehydrogenase
MKTFTIGKELQVDRLGFGAMRICGEGIWGWPKDRVEAKKLLRRVVELGINLIDTADAYGPEVSEYLLAEALHPYPEDLVIATKGGLVRGGPRVWETDGRPAHLRRAVENSLRRLGRETIDLYQLHAPDDEVPLEESVGALADAQRQGKIRHIGLSNVSVAELERAREVVNVVTVQNRFNLGDRTHEAVLDYCTAHGIGFIPWYPLATGELVHHPQLAEVATKYEASASQVALAWLLQRSKVMLPIPGTSRARHLEQNTHARELRLSDEDFQILARMTPATD